MSSSNETPLSDAEEQVEITPKTGRQRKSKTAPNPTEANLVLTDVAVSSDESLDAEQEKLTDKESEEAEKDFSALPSELVSESIEDAAISVSDDAQNAQVTQSLQVGEVTERPQTKRKIKKTEANGQFEPDSDPDPSSPEPVAYQTGNRPLLAMISKFFKPKKTRTFDTEALDPIDFEKPMVPEGLLESDLGLSATAIKRELAKQRREMRALDESRDRLEADIASKTERKLAYDEQVDRITSWKNQASRTFVWKVQQEMERNLAVAKSDMASHEKAVKELAVIEPGRLLKLRKSFHKSLTWALLVWGGLLGALTLIRFRESIPRLDWLAGLYDPNISGPILVIAIAAFVGLVILLSRRAKAKSSSLARIVWSTIFALLVAWIIWDSSQQNSYMQSHVNPFVDRHYAEIATGFFSAWAIWVFAGLISYYRGYSIFNRDVETQIHSLERVVEGYVKTQQEIVRLSSLYRQTNDWLEILANALYRPWKTHPEWGSSKEFTNHYETFPFALRVAQAREGADARMQELERIIGSRLLTQGWRNNAFEDLVAQIGIEMGLPPGKFVVDLLDQDLPHQSNNSRALLKRFLVHSASTSQSGAIDLGSNSAPPQAGKPDPTDRYLIEVARKRLLYLIDKTQSVAIAAARPRVEQIVDDPLFSLRADSAGVDEFDPTESWDQFLTDSLGADTVDMSPLGVLSFSEEGRMKNLPAKVQSFVLVPKRLEKTLPPISSESISVVPLGDDRPRSLEIISRIDVVGPVDLETVALLASTTDKSRLPNANKTRLRDVDEEL